MWPGRNSTPDKLNLVDIGKQFISRRTFDRLPCERVGIDLFHHVDHGCGAAIRQRAAIAQEPAITFLFPSRVRKRAVGIESPGANGSVEYYPLLAKLR
jgi:hypothetical protein